jgi:hypothetical protein
VPINFFSTSQLFNTLKGWYHQRVSPGNGERVASTLEYVIIAAIVCVAAVVVATLIVTAINNFGASIPTGP